MNSAIKHIVYITKPHFTVFLGSLSTFCRCVYTFERVYVVAYLICIFIIIFVTCVCMYLTNAGGGGGAARGWGVVGGR